MRFVLFLEQTVDVGIFDKLTFILIGFDDDPDVSEQLAAMINDNGGLSLCLLL